VDVAFYDASESEKLLRYPTATVMQGLVAAPYAIPTAEFLTDGPAGGVVLQLSTDALFLAGVREELVTMASEQNFELISRYTSPTGTQEKRVECVFSRARSQSLRLPVSIRNSARESAAYLAFQLTGQIHYSPAGLVFGLLPLPPE